MPVKWLDYRFLALVLSPCKHRSKIGKWFFRENEPWLEFLSLNQIVSSSLWSGMLTLILITSGTMACAQEGGVFDAAAPQSLILAPTNGAPVVTALLKSLKELKSYKFHADIRAIKDGKFKDNIGTFYFKSPNLMRVEVEGRGPKAGSKLVRNAQGALRFKGGPMLFGITMNMQPDSRLLRLPTGHLITECDYVSLFQNLAKEMAAGLKVKASPSAISLNPGKAIVLETQEPGQSVNLVSQRILIDAKTNVPISWIRFKDGRLNASVKFENQQLNPVVGDDMFSL